MKASAESPWSQLRWYSLRLELSPQRDIGWHSPALPILNALLKNVPVSLNEINPECPTIKRAYHLLDHLAHTFKCRAGHSFGLEILFFGGDLASVEHWLETFSDYLKTSPRSKFKLIAAESVIRHEGLSLCALDEPIPPHAELDFLAPLPFKRADGALRTGISLEAFLLQLRQRVKSLFGVELELPELGNVRCQAEYWDYREIPHLSKSQKGGHTQFYNGCVGPLYFRGELAAILPWLRLAAAIHGGGSLALNGLGYCQLHTPARPLFAEALGRPQTWRPALEYVQKNHDDWADDLGKAQGLPIDEERFCTELASSLAATGWQPGPALTFYVPKRDGSRRLEKLPVTELIIHTGLHEMLREPIDRLLLPTAFGYRRGRSVQAAIARIRSLIGQGYRYVVEADIEEFFPSVDLERMAQLLSETLPPADNVLLGRLVQLLHTPYLENGMLKPRLHGLMQGSPLSPLLANLYLTHFDAALSAAEAQWVRYADDFVILTRTRQQAESLMAQAQNELVSIGLTLDAEKSNIRDIAEGFRFLGQPFGGALPDDTLLTIAAKPIRKTLYVTEPDCFLGHNGGALEIRCNGHLREVLPLRRLAQIVVMARAVFSSGLIRQCDKLDIPLMLSLNDSKSTAVLAAVSRRQHRVAERHALHYAGMSATERLILAKAFAGRKIENYKPLILARYRRGDNDFLAALQNAQSGIEQAADTAAVRGHEGAAARAVFAAYNEFIHVPDFKFQRRMRERPDRMNSLFNFGYYLLFSRLNVLARSAGLNPYLGFLHDGDDNYESLVCDFEELFRAPVDRFLLALVNRKIIQADDFHDTPQGMRLHPVAVKRFLLRFEELLNSDAGGVSLVRAMELQIEAFQRYVTDAQPLWFFLYKAPSLKGMPGIEFNDGLSELTQENSP